MKLSFHKCSSAPWRQWVLSQGVGHIATRCYIKYLCCEEALDSSADPIKHLFWHSNEQVSSLSFYLSTTVMPQLFLQRHFIFYRGSPGSATFPFGYQSNPATVSSPSLKSLCVKLSDTCPFSWKTDRHLVKWHLSSNCEMKRVKTSWTVE